MNIDYLCGATVDLLLTATSGHFVCQGQISIPSLSHYNFSLFILIIKKGKGTYFLILRYRNIGLLSVLTFIGTFTV